MPLWLRVVCVCLVPITKLFCVCLLLQYLLQSCSCLLPIYVLYSCGQTHNIANLKKDACILRSRFLLYLKYSPSGRLKMKAPLDFTPPRDDWLLDDLHRHPSLNPCACAHAHFLASHCTPFLKFYARVTIRMS